MEVLVLHSENLTLAWFPTLVTLYQGLLCGGVVCVRRMSHYEKKRQELYNFSVREMSHRCWYSVCCLQKLYNTRFKEMQRLTDASLVMQKNKPNQNRGTKKAGFMAELSFGESNKLNISSAWLLYHFQGQWAGAHMGKSEYNPGWFAGTLCRKGFGTLIKGTSALLWRCSGTQTKDNL